MTPVFVHSPYYETDIGPHVFPVGKYRRVRNMLEASGQGPEAFVLPEEIDPAVCGLVHQAEYLEDFRACRSTPAVRSSELPITPEIVRWFETAVFGSITATRLATERGAAFHIGGGFHHAFADHAEGFCYLNDVAVAARHALAEGMADRISVVDLDVHQGNGTARTFQGDDRVFTFSMHQENNYPMKQISDLDDGLPDGIEDGEYLGRLELGLQIAVAERKPDLVYYVAGADPYFDDQLGGLSLTLDGLQKRDCSVFRACRAVGANVVTVLAGGYARLEEDTARIHVRTAEEMLAGFRE